MRLEIFRMSSSLVMTENTLAFSHLTPSSSSSWLYQLSFPHFLCEDGWHSRLQKESLNEPTGT
jgi:hypothetical protein